MGESPSESGALNETRAVVRPVANTFVIVGALGTTAGLVVIEFEAFEAND